MTGLPEQSAFHGLGLIEPLLDAIADRGYSEPTEIQVDAIPKALSGADILGCAQTGTGKTAAFVLPMLQRLAEAPELHGTIRCLILTPTRELADQVERAVAHYGARLSVESMVVYGGVPIGAQIKDLKFGCDVLVATPGRLLDHLERRTVDLSGVEVLVLDEADRMLDMGFIDDVRRIVGQIPKDRQTLLFSATMPNAILGLAHEMMQDPVSVQVGFQAAASGITQVLHPVDWARKKAVVFHLLDSWGTGPAIVFTRMKSTAASLCEFLNQKGVSVDDLHGDKGQTDRTRSLTRFREGKTRVLVATNVAARGLDIAGITHVVNFDVPDDPKDYVHRVGRTARGDQTGDAVTLMSPHEVMMVREIEKLTDMSIPRSVVEGFEPSFSPDIGKRVEVAEDAAPRSRLARGRRRR